MIDSAALRISIRPASRLPSTDDLAEVKELRDALNAVEGLRAGHAPRLTPGALRGEPQNAIDWAELLVTAGVEVPRDVTAVLLSTALGDWVRQRRGTARAARTLTMRAGGLELVLEEPTDDDVARAQALIEEWLKGSGGSGSGSADGPDQLDE